MKGRTDRGLEIKKETEIREKFKDRNTMNENEKKLGGADQIHARQRRGG